jgi:hypothetical protein
VLRVGMEWLRNDRKRNAVRAPKVKLGAIGTPYFPSLLLNAGGTYTVPPAGWLWPERSRLPMPGAEVVA